VKYPLLLAAALSLAAACGGPWIPVATEADAARTQTTVDELNRGRTILVRACAGCHTPPSPRDRIAADWPDQVESMRERARLTPEDTAAVTRYLTAFARDQVTK
jgi:mono/diheme cytochrome c family protein